MEWWQIPISGFAAVVLAIATWSLKELIGIRQGLALMTQWSASIDKNNQSRDDRMTVVEADNDSLSDEAEAATKAIHHLSNTATNHEGRIRALEMEQK